MLSISTNTPLSTRPSNASNGRHAKKTFEIVHDFWKYSSSHFHELYLQAKYLENLLLSNKPQPTLSQVKTNQVAAATLAEYF